MAGLGSAITDSSEPVSESFETNGAINAASQGDWTTLDTADAIEGQKLTETLLAADGATNDHTAYIGSNDGSLYAIDTDSGEVQWTFDAESSVLSSPTVADGTVYVGDDDGFVHAIDAADGTQRWSFDSEKEFGEAFSSPTVVDGTVYVGTYDRIWDDGTLHALDAESGSEQWSFETNDQIYSSPTVVDGTVYVGSNDNNVYAVDADDGTEEWAFETDHFVRSAPTVVDGTVYVGSYDGNLYAVDAESGGEMWSFNTGDDIYASPTVADGTVYVRSDDVYAVDADDGEEEWSTGAGSWGGSSPTVSGDTVYVGSDDGNLYALDAESGSERWAFGTGDRIRSTPAVFGETVYVGSLDGQAYAVDGDDGSERWAVDTGSAIFSSPTVAAADGDSGDSRVALGTLGHHEGWDGSSNAPVRGTVVDEFNRPVPGADVEIRPERRDTVLTMAADADGTWSIPLDEGTYEVVATVGDAEETRTVRHVGGETTVTHGLPLCADRNVRYGPESPSIVEPVDFQSCVDADDVEWDFGDGTTATGHAVSHQYDEPGSYDVALTADGETFTRTISVEDADIVIREYQDAFGGQIVESIVEENLYRIQVGSVDPVESVTVELDGETYEATEVDGESGVWETAVDTSDLDDDATVTITATDVEGNEDTAVSSLQVVSVPDEFVFLLDVGDKGAVPAIAERVEYEGSTGSLIPSMEFELFDVTIVDDSAEYDELGTLTPWRTDFGFNATAEMGFAMTIPAGSVSVDGEISGETSVAGNTVRGGGGADVTYDGTGLAAGSEIYFFAGLERSMPLSPPALPGRIEVVVGGDVGTAFATDGDGGWDFTADAAVSGETPVETNVAPGVDLAASAGLELSSEATFDTPPELAFKEGTIGVEGFVEGELDATVYSNSVTITWPEAEGQFGSSSMSTADIHRLDENGNVETEFGGWEVQEKRGENPLPSVATVDEATARGVVAAQSTTEETGTDRLTGRPYEDTEPTVTAIGNETVVLWSTQRENRSVLEGRDLAVRTRDASGWSDPTFLTDDDRHDESPTIAASDDGDELLAGWTRTDVDLEEENLTTPEEVYPHQEIAVAHYDGNDWSEQTLLTDSDELTHGPTVAGADGTWLIAWERNSDGDAFATDNRSVEYAVLDGTNVTERGTIDDAMSPAVGSADDGFDLSYYEPVENGTERGAVVHGTVADGGAFDEQRRYDSRDYIDHDTDGGQLAWINGSLDDPELFHDDGNDVETLDLNANMSDVEELTLDVDGDDALLTYRARPETDAAADLVYRFSRNGEWITDRRVAGGPDTELALYHSEAVLTADSFDVVYAASEFGPDTKNDVFVTSRAFHPDYVVAADAPSDVAAGESVDVDYEVTNVGETESEGSVPVVLSSEGTDLETEDVGPLAPNETVTGTFEATADDSGTFDVTVGQSASTLTAAADGDREHWLPRSTSVTTGTPALSVDAVETAVDSNDSSQGTIAVTVANNGTVPVESVPVAIEYGNETHELVVEDVPLNGTATGSLTLDPATVDESALGELVVDPHGELDEAAIEDRTYRTKLFTADLALDGPPTYVDAGGDLEAIVDVANRGELATNATVRIVEADPAGNETTAYGSATIELDGTTPSQTAFESVSIPLEGVQAGDAVRIVAESSAVDADRSATGLEDEVGPIVPERGPIEVAVEASTGEPISNATVLIDDVGATTDANGTAAFAAPTGTAALEVAADGFAPATENVSVRSDEVTTLSVELDPEPAALTALEAPDRVAVGGNATISATVENPAPIERDVPLTLSAANETVDESSVTVGPDATANRTLSWEPASNATDPVPLTVSAPADEATTEIRVENGSAFADDLAVANLTVANVSVEEERVVFENNGSTEIDLGEWTIRDREDGGQVARGLEPFAFPDDFTLEANATVTVWTGEGTNTETDLYWGYGVHMWNAEGDVVILEAPDGDRVLEYAYGDQAD